MFMQDNRHLCWDREGSLTPFSSATRSGAAQRVRGLEGLLLARGERLNDVDDHVIDIRHVEADRLEPD
jgi:hypothetical protein